MWRQFIRYFPVARCEALVPNDFGVPDGSEISNKSTILKEISDAIKKPEKPTVEYIVTMPYSSRRLLWPLHQYGFSYSVFGHSALRYTNPETGEDIVVNIHKQCNSGSRNQEYENKKKMWREKPNSIVEFYPTEEYLFGLNTHNLPSQGGIYNRNIHTIRLDLGEDDDPEIQAKILKLHNFFKNLENDSHNQTRKFDLVLGPIYNIVRFIFPTLSERGNCAYWITKGLKEAGFVKHNHIFPRNTWIELFENTPPEKTTVIYYHQAQEAKRLYGYHDSDVKPIISLIAPFQLFKNCSYSKAPDFAKLHVKIPDGSTQAMLEINENSYQPSKVRNLVNHPIVVFSSIFVSLYAIRRGGGYLRNQIKKRFYKES